MLRLLASLAGSLTLALGAAVPTAQPEALAAPATAVVEQAAPTLTAASTLGLVAPTLTLEDPLGSGPYCDALCEEIAFMEFIVADLQAQIGLKTLQLAIELARCLAGDSQACDFARQLAFDLTNYEDYLWDAQDQLAALQLLKLLFC